MDVKITKRCMACEGTGKLSLTKEVKNGKIPDGEDVISCPACDGKGYESFTITNIVKLERIYDPKDYAIDA
jgi:excinuclease UvrABC ATPase subunit